VPSPEHPLTGRCACGAVRFVVTQPFQSAGYCHCRRCRRRSGVPWSYNGLVATSGFELTAGSETVSHWQPEGGGRRKSFCRSCGGHLFSGDPEREDDLAVRLGAVEGDPEVEPTWRMWISSAPDWCPIPEDGLPRFTESRTTEQPHG
jgi:hypothetical protein